MSLSHDARAELAQELRSALGRFGVAGEVRVTESHALLLVQEQVVRVELGAYAADWQRAEGAERPPGVEDLARRLASAWRRQCTTPETRRDWGVWLKALAALGALLLSFVAIRALSASWTSTAGDSLYLAEKPRQTAAQVEAERQQRATLACNSARSRVLRGATLGPTDVEGWVVEVAWYGTAEVNQAALAPFVAWESESEGQLTDPEAPELNQIRGPGTRVVLHPSELLEAPGGFLHGARLEFTQRYVLPYFQKAERIRFIRLARRIAECFEARLAALYARCAHTDRHYAGSWFFGPNTGHASAALVYWMGSFADDVHFPLSDDSEAARHNLLLRLLSATRDLDKNSIRDLLAPHGGMVAGRDGDALTLRFEFSDSNRASRASRAIARNFELLPVDPP